MSDYNLMYKGDAIEVREGMSFQDVARMYQKDDEPLIVAATIGNRLRELSEVVDTSGELEFVDTSGLDGTRIYQRSLTFVFIRAAMEIFYGIRLITEHSLNKGLLFRYDFNRELDDKDVEEIKNRMAEIINADEPFVRQSITKAQAVELFNRHRMEPKVRLLKYRKSDTINVYTCGWLKNYFYGYMVPSTGYLKVFDLVKFNDGIILRYPIRSNPRSLPEYIPNPKIAAVYRESDRWNHILGVDYVADLNEIVENGEYTQLLRVAEALHEKRIAQIADMITEEKKRVILIAGPSSSGKTTFANRLSIQLRVNGLFPIMMSTDDYFVDRTRTPLDENGDYDFESLRAVDTERFNEDLTKLLKGEKVKLPAFNFLTGQSGCSGKEIQITDENPIIIEGIHGLNEALTSKVARKKKFKIYISALTTLSIDEHNRIPTTDSRLIRRIVRDARTRGHSAARTIQLWPAVRKGEEINIFPYQEEADVVFNSSLNHEVAFLKKHAQPELEKITSDEPEYIEAVRLLKFLNYFVSAKDDHIIPANSILREFVGGSCFKV